MADLIYRSTKGSRLTSAEGDGNMSELNRRTGQGWSDMPSPVTILTGASAPTTTAIIGGIVGMQFSADVNQECFSNAHLNHDYIVGSMVYPHIHFTTKGTTSGTVRCGVEWTLARRSDSTGLVVFGATQTLYIEKAITGSDTLKHMICEPADGFGIDGTNLETDSLILFRYFRDAEHVNDTYTEPVIMLVVDVHYQCDKLSTPLRTPPFI